MKNERRRNRRSSNDSVNSMHSIVEEEVVRDNSIAGQSSSISLSSAQIREREHNDDDDNSESSEEDDEKLMSSYEKIGQYQSAGSSLHFLQHSSSSGSDKSTKSTISSPDEIVADVATSSMSLMVYENDQAKEEVVENEDDIENDSRQVASSSSSYLLPQKRPAEISTAIFENVEENNDLIISPSRKEITLKSPMSMSTISPHEAIASSTANNTATARFGRLLQECRELTETCEDSTSAGVSESRNSSSESKDKSSSLSSTTTGVNSPVVYQRGVGTYTTKVLSRNPLVGYKREADALQQGQEFRQRKSYMSDLSAGVDYLMYGDVMLDEIVGTTPLDKSSSHSGPWFSDISTSDHPINTSDHPIETFDVVENKQQQQQQLSQAVITNVPNYTPQNELKNSWLSYDSNPSTDKELTDTHRTTSKQETSPKQKTSPFDEIQIPSSNESDSSNHSTEVDKGGGDGLLVGFGDRTKLIPNNEDSSVSSSDSSGFSSSGSGDSSSYETGSSSTGGSNSESSDDEEMSSSDGESSALAHLGLHIPPEKDSDLVSELSFSGASALIGVVTGANSSLPMTSTESFPEDPTQRTTQLSPKDPNQKAATVNSNELRFGDNAQTRLVPHERKRLAKSRARSLSRDPMLEKLDELSESNASFLDDASSIGEAKPFSFVPQHLAEFGKIFDEKSNASFLDDVSSMHEPDAVVQTSLAPSDADLFASSKTPQDDDSGGTNRDHSSTVSPTSKIEESPYKYVPSTLSSARPSADAQDTKLKSSKDEQKARRSSKSQSSRGSSSMSKKKMKSNTNLGSGSYYSEIIARAISLKSSNASVKSSNASAESFSASSLSSRRQQQGMEKCSRGQDAGINTVEKLHGIREEAANSSRLTRQLDEVPDDVIGQQRKQQGSGESAMEKISPYKEDDLSLSSMSSVVSRANDSLSNSAHFAARRASGGEIRSTSSSGGIQSRQLLKSDGDASFTGDEVLEDFPSTRQPSSTLTLLPVDMEADSKKPWMTVPRSTVLDISFVSGSRESVHMLESEHDVESQRRSVAGHSDKEGHSEGSDQLSYMKALMDDIQPEAVKTSEHCSEAAMIDERENSSEIELRSSMKSFAAAAKEMTSLLRQSMTNKQFQSGTFDKSRSNSQHSSQRDASESESSVYSECADESSEIHIPIGDDEESEESEHVINAMLQFKKSDDEESVGSKKDINAMLQVFKKRDSVMPGDTEFYRNQIDTISDSSSNNSPLPKVDAKYRRSSSMFSDIVEDIWDDDDENDDDDTGTAKKNSLNQEQDRPNPKLVGIVIFLIILSVAIGIGIAVARSKNVSNPPTELQTAPPTLLPAPQPPNWVQLGDLLGESLTDEAGYSVSVSEDSSRVIIGGRRNQKDDMKNRGAARIFQIDAATSKYVPTYDIYGEAAGDQCGFAVSISRNGKRIAVGSIGSDKNGNNAGQVRIYDEDELTKSWTLIHEMFGDQDTALFGTSISLSLDGELIAIGAPYHSEGAGMTKSGRVYVYREDQDSVWTQVGLPIYGASTNDVFGWSVSFLPSTRALLVAVGAPRLKGSLESGYVKVFSFDGIAWQLYGESMSIGYPGDQFGTSVSLAGYYTQERIVIGAPLFEKGNGIVVVYENVSNGWQRFGNDLIGERDNANFGESVYMTPDATRMIVGAPNKKLNNVRVGLARMFNVDEDSIQYAGDIFGLNGENVGVSVSLSDNGMFAYVGASTASVVRTYTDVT